MRHRPRRGPFEVTWDPRKARKNLRGHKVSFEEGVTVWFDPLARVRQDAVHADRYVITGVSSWRRVLVSVFAEVTETGARIISSWKATRSERRSYEEGEFGEACRRRRRSNPFLARIMRYGLWVHPQTNRAHNRNPLAARVAREGLLLRPHFRKSRAH